MIEPKAPTQLDFEAWNERMSREHDPDEFHTKSSFIVRFLERRRVAGVVKLLDAQPADRILEVGCGAGNVLERIPAGQLYGIDLSSHLVEKARRLLGERAVIEKADAENLPFENGYFTKTYCTEVLEHVLRPERVLAEVHRVLAPGGLLVVSVPYERVIVGLKRLLKRIGLYGWVLKSPNGYQTPEANEWHLHEFTPDKLRELVRPYFHLDRLVALPNRLLTLHYLARCRKPTG